jgi:5-hydroxyisourate hydrolase-like protein (transthyretin family)
MRRVVLAGVALPLLISIVPASAADTGTIKGRVVNETTGEPQRGVDVKLVGAEENGNDRQEETVTTGDDGTYLFEDLPTGNDRFYVLDVRFEGGLFPSSAITIPSDTTQTPVIDTQIRVWSTTTDPAAILIEHDNMFVVPNDTGVGVVESVTIANLADEAYIGRGGDDPGADEESVPSLGFSLPPGADEEGVSIIESDLDIPELMRTSFGFAITTAIPPGSTSLTFSYSVPGTAGAYDLSRRALYPILDLSVYVSDPLELSSPRLSSKGEVDIDDKTYVRYTIDDDELDAGDSVQMLALADAGTSPGLLLGMAGVLVLVLALGLFPVWRYRRRKASEEPSAPESGRSREDVLREIAEIDLRRERGELDEAEWSGRRAALKKELIEDADRSRT